MTTPILSVITVVYNNASDIERTLRSVIGQSYPHIEYLVIDGGSKDGTWEIIQRYAPQIAVTLSEPDEGIYHAMNKGLALATGTHVLFMNSGDEFFSPQTVQEVFEGRPFADIYYGETQLINSEGENLGMRRLSAPEVFDWKSFQRGMNVCHQAIYVRKAIAPPYDLQYKLSADIDWVIRAAKNASIIINTHSVVAKYLEGGLSKQRHWESLRERYQILSKHYGFFKNIWNHFRIVLRYLLFINILNIWV